MISERGIWLSRELVDKHVFDESLGNAIVELFREAKTVIDIGCGVGKYVKKFRDNGIDCVGFDGCPLTPEIAEGFCEVKDFSDPVSIGKFDLVMSLEVGEHIPPQYEQNFIGNICRSARKNIVMSWATVGQGGDGHYNERDNDYVISEICKRGFAYDQNASDLLRGESQVPWFKNTIMVFTRVSNPVTAIFFSCTRIEILKNTISDFLWSNTYPIFEMIIVNDSADPAIHAKLRELYPNYTLVLNKYNVGLIKSIDLGYRHIKTDYFFHCEDDWTCIGKGGFIEQSLDIMESREDIEEVWLQHYNNHPINDTVLQAEKRTPFRIVGDDGPWHGFTTACGLKRLSDYLKVGPYSKIKWEKTIWHRECAIGLEYYKLGYKSAITMDDYVKNTGLGKSEYITGTEHKLKIEVYCLAHNEERIMPYFMRHYSRFAKVIILENNSKDRTVEIASSMGAEIRVYDVPDEINDLWYIDVKNTCWQDSKADWVMVVDCDEFIYHPDIINILRESEGTIIEPKLFEMFSAQYPTTEGQIYDEIKTGCDGGPKINTFRPSEISQIHYNAGCHSANPEGNIIYDYETGIVTLHMRFLSKQYLKERNAYAARRLSQVNLDTKLGYHYLWTEEQLDSYFDGHLAKSTQVIP